ncbi:MAG: hypothetical protein EXR72_24100 [Myxococcales bacterium]|nr:hypothetical protein [Myxococcales bacterium]
MTGELMAAFEVASRLAAALEAANIPYAIGGAIALGAWSDPRGTHDVDLNLFVDHDGLDAALDVLVAAGVVIDRGAARLADEAGDVLVGHYGGLRVDLFTPSIPFAWEAMTTRRRLRGPSDEAYYLSPEALAIFKLLFFRSKDLLDVEKLVAVQGADLDSAYIRRWIVEMMGEEDERVAAWDRIVANNPP